MLKPRFTDGVKVAVVPEYVTAPGTSVAPCFRVNEVVVSVEGSIASSKLTETALLTVTPVAALAGIVELVVGAVVSGAAPVVKLQTVSVASAFPARSFATVLMEAV